MSNNLHILSILSQNIYVYSLADGAFTTSLSCMREAVWVPALLPAGGGGGGWLQECWLPSLDAGLQLPGSAPLDPSPPPSTPPPCTIMVSPCAKATFSWLNSVCLQQCFTWLDIFGAVKVLVGAGAQ